MAESRTGLKFVQGIESIFSDLKYRFPEMTQEEFSEIMKRGCLLEYGKIYRLTVSSICEWVNEYYKSKGELFSIYKLRGQSFFKVPISTFKLNEENIMRNQFDYKPEFIRLKNESVNVRMFKSERITTWK